jgi:hypothetical protein
VVTVAGRGRRPLLRGCPRGARSATGNAHPHFAYIISGQRSGEKPMGHRIEFRTVFDVRYSSASLEMLGSLSNRPSDVFDVPYLGYMLVLFQISMKAPFPGSGPCDSHGLSFWIRFGIRIIQRTHPASCRRASPPPTAAVPRSRRALASLPSGRASSGRAWRARRRVPRCS